MPGARLRRRERPGRDQGRLRGAALHRRQAARRGASRRRGRDQRAAGSAPPARRPRATLPLPAGRDRVRPSRAPLSRTEPRARGPAVRVLRRSSAETAAPPVAPWSRARGLPPRLRALLPRGGGCRQRRAAAALEQPEARARTVRRHRRRARLPRRARDAAPAARLRRGRGRRARRALRSSPRRAEGRLPGRSRGPWSRHAGRAAPGDEFDGRGKRPLRPREPRHEAHAETPRARRADHARPRRVVGAARARAAGVQGGGRDLPRRPREPLRPRRRPAGGGARRPAGRDAGSGVGQGAGLRALRRDDRRDRRARSPGEIRLGFRVPGAEHGRLRTHAGRATGVGEPHDQHRHRMRVRRPAHSAPLSGARARLRARGAHLLRARAAARHRTATPSRAATARRAARHRRRHGEARSSRPASITP